MLDGSERGDGAAAQIGTRMRCGREIKAFKIFCAGRINFKLNQSIFMRILNSCYKCYF